MSIYPSIHNLVFTFPKYQHVYILMILFCLYQILFQCGTFLFFLPQIPLKYNFLLDQLIFFKCNLIPQPITLLLNCINIFLQILNIRTCHKQLSCFFCQLLIDWNQFPFNKSPKFQNNLINSFLPSIFLEIILKERFDNLKDKSLHSM